MSRMSGQRTSVILSALLAFLLAPANATAADEAAGKIETPSLISTVFSGTEMSVEIVVRDAVPTRLAWGLQSASRTLVRGEGVLEKHPDDGTFTGRILVQLPDIQPVKELRLQLAIAALDAAGKSVAEVQKQLWILPTDPFAGWKQVLEERSIALYDPAGGTRDLLDSAGLKTVAVPNQRAFEHLEAGLLIVGEGIALERAPQLAGELLAVAARGIPVLWLPAESGRFRLPQAADDPLFHRLQRVHWERDGIVARLDKRLDVTAWAPREDAFVRRPITTTARSGIVYGEIETGGWTYAEWCFDPSGSRLIYSGLSVVAEWERSPMPRYWLSALVRDLTEPPQPEPVTADRLGAGD